MLQNVPKPCISLYKLFTGRINKKAAHSSGFFDTSFKVIALSSHNFALPFLGIGQNVSLIQTR